MKRLFTVLLVLSMVLLMSACMQEEDYYTRAEVETLLAEQRTALQDQFEEEFNELGDGVEAAMDAQTAEIAMLQAELGLIREDARRVVLTTEERYFLSLVSDIMDTVYFAELNTTVYGTVPDYGYAYIILEVEVPITVQIELIRVAPDGAWDLNIYDNGHLTTPVFTDEEVVQGVYIIYELTPGFNSIEFDSYLEMDYDFIVEITIYQP